MKNHKKWFETKSELRDKITDLECLLDLRTEMLRLAIKNNEITYRERIVNGTSGFEKEIQGFYISKNNYIKKYEDYERKAFRFKPNQYETERLVMKNETNNNKRLSQSK